MTAALFFWPAPLLPILLQNFQDACAKRKPLYPTRNLSLGRPIASPCARTLFRLVTLACVLLGPVLVPISIEAQTQTETLTQAPPQASSASGISVERFAELVGILAHPSMDGRGPGWPGHDRARDFIEAQLAAIEGLEPAFVIDGETSSQQPFEYQVGLLAVAPTLGCAVPGEAAEAEVRQLEMGVDGAAVPFGFSGDGSFDAEVVFMGYGVRTDDHDSYANQDVSGKAVVVFRYEPMDDQGRSRLTEDGGFSGAAALFTKARWAQEAGAAAFVVVNPPQRNDGPLRPLASTAMRRSLSIPCMHVTLDAFREILADAGMSDQDAAEVLQQQANDAPLAMTLDDVRLQGGIQAIESEFGVAENVGFMLRGVGDLAHEVVYIGAHYDHCGHGEVGSRTGSNEVHPGADDNASGTAAVIMTAEALAKRYAHPLLRDEPRRSVVFLLFSAEERGLIGSAHLVQKPQEMALDLGRGVAMVNLDMIGRYSGGGLRIFGIETADPWTPLVLNATRPYGIEPALGGRAAGGSDHRNFGRVGIPAVHLFTGLHDEYHTEFDTADLIDNEGGTLIAGLTADLLQSLVTGPALREVPGPDENGTPLPETSPEPAPGLPRDAASEPAPEAAPEPTPAPAPETRPGVAQEPDPAAEAPLDAEPAAVARPWLGIRLAPQEGGEGMVVTRVVADSPAARAGFQRDDVVLLIGGVSWAEDAVENLAQRRPGEVVVVTIQRDEEMLELSVTLGGR